MRPVRLMLSWLAFCTLALGCAPMGPAFTGPPLPPVREDTIGRLRVDGINAFINGQRVQGGNYVFDGDTVSTGPATSAKLLLNDGGEIQLDENTDPLFKKGACLLMKILRGRVAFHNMHCQEFEDGFKMAGVARSYVHIMSTQFGSRVTVIAGEVDMRSPTRATLRSDMQYVATSEGTAQVLQLTPEQAVATVAWTRNFFRPPVMQSGNGLLNGFQWPSWPGGMRGGSGSGSDSNSGSDPKPDPDPDTGRGPGWPRGEIKPPAGQTVEPVEKNPSPPPPVPILKPPPKLPLPFKTPPRFDPQPKALPEPQPKPAPDLH